MPRDTVALPEAPTPHEIQILDDIAQLLANPRHWCKGKRVRGRRFGFAQPAYCLTGAFDTVTGYRTSSQGGFPGYGTAAFTVWATLAEETNRLSGVGIIGFNDRRKTTHADIQALIASARAILFTRI